MKTYLICFICVYDAYKEQTLHLQICLFVITFVPGILCYFVTAGYLCAIAIGLIPLLTTPFTFKLNSSLSKAAGA